jgi:hypothetical protein
MLNRQMPPAAGRSPLNATGFLYQLLFAVNRIFYVTIYFVYGTGSAVYSSKSGAPIAPPF